MPAPTAADSLDAYRPAQIAVRVAESGGAKARLPLVPLLALAAFGGTFNLAPVPPGNIPGGAGGVAIACRLAYGPRPGAGDA